MDLFHTVIEYIKGHALLFIPVFAFLGWFVLTMFRPIKLDWVNYMSAPLGHGKTSFAVFVAHHYHLRGYKVYANFPITFAEQLNTVSGEWPKTRKAVIILDEITQLGALGALPMEWLVVGITMARHLEQHIILLGQSNRPTFKRDFWGAIGNWMVVTGVSFGKRGRLLFVRQSQNPFVRGQNGMRASGNVKAFYWLSGAVFKMYDTHELFGLEEIKVAMEKKQSKGPRTHRKQNPGSRGFAPALPEDRAAGSSWRPLEVSSWAVSDDSVSSVYSEPVGSGNDS